MLLRTPSHVVLTGLLLGGCTHSYVDQSGTRHTVTFNSPIKVYGSINVNNQGQVPAVADYNSGTASRPKPRQTANRKSTNQPTATATYPAAPSGTHLVTYPNGYYNFVPDQAATAVNSGGQAAPTADAQSAPTHPAAPPGTHLVTYPNGYYSFVSDHAASTPNANTSALAPQHPRSQNSPAASSSNSASALAAAGASRNTLNANSTSNAILAAAQRSVVPAVQALDTAKTIVGCASVLGSAAIFIPGFEEIGVVSIPYTIDRGGEDCVLGLANLFVGAYGGASAQSKLNMATLPIAPGGSTLGLATDLLKKNSSTTNTTPATTPSGKP